MFAARETTKRRVGAGLKKRIAYRQHYICTGCKKLLPPTYEVDHIQPLFCGGSNHEANLQALCPNCHREKTQTEQMGGAAQNPQCARCQRVHSPYFTHRCPVIRGGLAQFRNSTIVFR